MKWAVEELKRLGNETLSLDQSVRVDDLKQKDSQIRNISPVRVKGDVFVSDSFISFHLNISGQMILPCSLTLEDVDYPFSIDTIESFQLKQDVLIDEEENEMIHEIEGQMIDLMPMIKEAILLSIPMKVVHPQAKVKSSGDGWDIVTGNEKKDKIDPRMAKLAEFFKKDKDDR